MALLEFKQIHFIIENHEEFKSKYAPDGIEPRAEFRVPRGGDLILTVTGELIGGNDAFFDGFGAEIVVKAKNTFKNALVRSGWKCPIWGACSIVRYVGDKKFWVRYTSNGSFFEVPIREEDGPDLPDEIIGRCELMDGYPV